MSNNYYIPVFSKDTIAYHCCEHIIAKWSFKTYILWSAITSRYNKEKILQNFIDRYGISRYLCRILL